MPLCTPVDQLTTTERWTIRSQAGAMPLKGGPKSPQAAELVDTLTNTVVLPYRATSRQLRPTMVPKYRQALGATLADVLTAAGDGKWAKRRMANEALSGCPGGRGAFRDARRALEAKGYLQSIPGFRKAPNGPHSTFDLTCFRPTPALLQAANDHGVRLDNVRLHFAADLGSKPRLSELVVVRSKTQVDGKKASLTPANDDLVLVAQRDRMARLNAFLSEKGRVEGIVFGGLRRIFSHGDQPGFQWQWGGRLYSLPGWEDYITKPKETRQARLRLDGEETLEIDISAAHLTILYGLRGQDFDARTDPYIVPGRGAKGRNGVKLWLTRALGASSLSVGGKPYQKVRKAVLAHHPILTGLEGYGITALDLQYHESEIVLAALEELTFTYGVTALPVHDALIVPKSKVDLAENVLVEAFQRYFKDTLGKEVEVIPLVRCKSA